MSASGEVYSKYKRGPRTDRCGTPRSKERREDRQLLTLTNCVRDVKYDFSQESTVPLIHAGSLSEVNHDTLNKYFGKIRYFFCGY